MTIYEKLMCVQQNLKAPKNQFNFFGKYHYRSCEDIQEALKPIMAEVKAILLLNDEIVMIGSRYYIKASAIFQDAESNEKIVNVAYARETEDKPKMDAAQITGSCSSYARKYALNGLFCIDDAKDPDAVQPQQENQRNNTGSSRQPQAVSVGAAHIATIRKELERTGANEASVLSRYKLQRIENMTMEQYKKAMDVFKTMPSKVPDNYQMNLEEMQQGIYDKNMPFR